MLIPIIQKNQEPDSVPPHILDRMLANNEIYAFERSSGWAVVGRDPIRTTSRRPYFGPERRMTKSIRAYSLTV